MRRALIIASAFALAAPASAQSPEWYGSAAGTITDAATGAPITGAEILLIAGDTTRAVADDRGAWRAPRLPAGTYETHVRALGFRAARSSLVVSAGTVTQSDAMLTPLAVALHGVVVTAARREQKLKDVIVATEVIGRGDIERSGASDLAAVLVEQTGIELLGGHPNGSGVMIQGLGSERVLVLLDGQPVAGRIAGQFDVSRIPTSVVERVEIVKGPQGTLYGSDAIGGVVNVITRVARSPGIGVAGNFTAGTQGRLDGAASAELGTGPLSGRVDVGRRFIETTPGRSDLIGALAARNDLAASLQWRSEAGVLDASFLGLDERQRWRSGALYQFADNEQWSGRLAFQRGGLRALLYGSAFEHLSRGSSEPLPIAGDTGQLQVQRLFQGEVLYNGRVNRHAFDVGVQLRRDDTRSVRIPGGLRSLVTAEPLAQLELVPTDNLGISAGVRMSRSSEWGTHVTPRLALRHSVLPTLTLRASAGTGFRAPDFRELYMFFVNDGAGYSVRGNPDLRPEHSRNLMLGADLTRDAVFARAQLYWNEFTDFIETRPVSAPGDAPVYQYGNVDNGRTRGAELEAGLSLSRLRVEGGYSVLETRDHATGASLLGRPPHSARMLATHPLPLGIRVTASAFYTSRTPMQRDSAGTIIGWRDAFARLDLRAIRTIGADIDLVIGADNLLDTRPREWAGLTRRHIYTGLSWNTALRRN